MAHTDTPVLLLLFLFLTPRLLPRSLRVTVRTATNMMAAVRRHPPNTSKGLFSSSCVHMAHGLSRGPTDPQLCVVLSPGKPPRLTMSR